MADVTVVVVTVMDMVSLDIILTITIMIEPFKLCHEIPDY